MGTGILDAVCANHRIDAHHGLAGLVMRVAPEAVGTAGVLLAIRALDSARVGAHPDIATALSRWREGRPADDTNLHALESLRLALDMSATDRACAAADEREVIFRRARAVAALVYAIRGGREGLREVVCEAVAAVDADCNNARNVIAGILSDHIPGPTRVPTPT